MPRDYYEILGLARDADPDEIKRAYRKLALANHPDRNPGDEAAAHRFKEAAQAFEVLSDLDKRARYDRFGHAGVEGQLHDFRSAEDIFSVFRSIFGEDSLFGGIFGGGVRGGGHSLKTRLRIGFLESARGVEKTLELRRREVCGDCRGSGCAAGRKPERCATCSGHGRVRQQLGFLMTESTCPHCQGRGTVVRDPCKTCKGTGTELRAHALSVSVPAGIEHGQTLRLQGEGEDGPGGGPRGDLYVTVEVEEHPVFRRHENHLVLELPISYAQAVLGAQVEIPTLNGPATLKIPRGTQHGDQLRLRGKGFPDLRGYGPGDLVALASLEVPKKVSARQEELLRQLAEVEATDVSPRRRSFLDTVKDLLGAGE